MFGIGFTKKLKAIIELQDDTIKQLRIDSESNREAKINLREKEIEITRLKTENLILQNRINGFITDIMSEPKQIYEQAGLNKNYTKEESPPVHPNLQAYYDRGKNKKKK